ncbi:hypothetical protein Pcinc_016932 [Petrolisthes cinctipes]|uniref:Sushi domain-containing protein n=1 Tax=Petrolisthes cinctipes TaxID=88211 RepID=A0AAE1KNY9_PETCI|nr:hypothetical protein Pcinc_016932 [Petrolisthes cinctipes]
MHRIITQGQPCFARPRRLPPETLQAAKKEFEQLLQEGTIRPSDSSWSSPLHMPCPLRVPHLLQTAPPTPTTAETYPNDPPDAGISGATMAWDGGKGKGVEAKYECESGTEFFSGVNETTAVCSRHYWRGMEWVFPSLVSPLIHSCIERQTSPPTPCNTTPDTPINVMVTFSSQYYISYSCSSPGETFPLGGIYVSATCEDNNIWTFYPEPLSSCLVLECIDDPPSAPAEAKGEWEGNTLGNRALYSCQDPSQDDTMVILLCSINNNTSSTSLLDWLPLTASQLPSNLACVFDTTTAITITDTTNTITDTTNTTTDTTTNTITDTTNTTTDTTTNTTTDNTTNTTTDTTNTTTDTTSTTTDNTTNTTTDTTNTTTDNTTNTTTDTTNTTTDTTNTTTDNTTNTTTDTTNTTTDTTNTTTDNTTNTIQSEECTEDPWLPSLPGVVQEWDGNRTEGTQITYYCGPDGVFCNGEHTLTLSCSRP